MQLPANLKNAIEEIHRIKKHGAIRRQLQYIGRLMRDVDADDIQMQYQNITQHSAKAVQQLHKIEKWRERLLEEGDVAIQALVKEFPDIDRQQLRQLIRTALLERSKEKPPRAYRKLFQLLKSEYE